MSEYQYYDFLAIEKALTRQQQGELRRISSRAVITSRRMHNEYHYGNFKGDCSVLLKNYFDLFLYNSNFGLRSAFFRVPAAPWMKEAFEPFRQSFQIERSDDYWLIEIEMDDGQGSEPDYDVDVTILEPLRARLLQGKLDALYIPWLAEVHNLVEDDPEAAEPCSMTMLSPLDTDLREYAWFLGVPSDILEHAYASVTDSPEPNLADKSSLERWVKSLKAKEREELIMDLLLDQTGTQAKQIRELFAGKMTTAEISSRPQAEKRRVYELVPPAGLSGDE